MFKYILFSILIVLSLSITGCTTEKIVYKERVEYVQLDKTLFLSCAKPTTIKQDLPELDLSKDLKDIDVDELRLITVYANSKVDHFACYNTVVNLWETQKRIIQKRQDLEKARQNE